MWAQLVVLLRPAFPARKRVIKFSIVLSHGAKSPYKFPAAKSEEMSFALDWTNKELEVRHEPPDNLDHRVRDGQTRIWQFDYWGDNREAGP